MYIVDLRKEELKEKGLIGKINSILTSFQLLFFISALVIIQFILLAFSKILSREDIRKDSSTSNVPPYMVIEYIIYVFDVIFFIELILQLSLGYGTAYLKNIWCIIDSFLIIGLFTLATLTLAGVKDTTLTLFRFLIVLRLIRVLALMSEFTTQTLLQKKEKREQFDIKINAIRMDMMNEDLRNAQLKEKLRLAVLQLCKMEKNLINSKKETDLLTRRYTSML